MRRPARDVGDAKEAWRSLTQKMIRKDLLSDDPQTLCQVVPEENFTLDGAYQKGKIEEW